MFNPTHIDLFRAVMRHGGITRAAAALGLGQPHVSRSIAQLEAAVGFPLFVRGHGSATPTREGEAFAREVERTYAGLDGLALAARRIREAGAAPLRVACQPSLAAGLLPRAVRRLAAEQPGVEVAILVPDPDAIWSWTADGRCDFGLGRPRPGFAGVASETFSTVDAVLALPRRHPLARRRGVALEDLAGVPLIAGGAGGIPARGRGGLCGSRRRATLRPRGAVHGRALRPRGRGPRRRGGRPHGGAERRRAVRGAAGVAPRDPHRDGPGPRRRPAAGCAGRAADRHPQGRARRRPGALSDNRHAACPRADATAGCAS